LSFLFHESFWRSWYRPPDTTIPYVALFMQGYISAKGSLIPHKLRMARLTQQKSVFGASGREI
jgi:hypothetical protein